MEEKKVPVLRFRGFDNAWEQCKFSDVVEIGSGMDYKHLGIGDIPVYGTGGYMLSVDVALSENNDAIGIGRKGTIDKPYILRAPFWTVDTLFYCIPKYNHNLDFTNCLFQNIDWKNKDESTGVPSLSKVIINSIETSIPSYEEQKKIGEYFKSFENLIILHQRKLEMLKKVKKSMLEKMFPKNDAKVPELRFSDFTDAWEQRKLGDSLSFLKDGTHGTHADSIDGPLLLSAKNIKNGSVNWDETDRRISQDEYDKIHSNFNLENGDILLTIVGSIGETAILKDSSGLTFQRSVAFLRPKEEVTSEFLYTEIQIPAFQKELESRKSTSAQPGIYLGDLSEIPVVISKSKDEQRKIGSYFANLDNLIILHQRKLEKLKNIKKSMLEKMFII